MASGAKNWRGSLMKASKRRLCLEQCKGRAKWAKLWARNSTKGLLGN
jgi:hypothetical protein